LENVPVFSCERFKIRCGGRVTGTSISGMERLRASIRGGFCGSRGWEFAAGGLAGRRFAGDAD